MNCPLYEADVDTKKDNCPSCKWWTVEGKCEKENDVREWER